MRALTFAALAALAACASPAELDALRRENTRLRAELDKAKEAPPEPTAPAVELADGWRLYTVRNRDALSDIAQRLLGDLTRWEEVYAANREQIGDDPDRLPVGLELRIPPRDG